MAKVRHLKNAPIVEAIIDFRVKLPPDFDPNLFSSLKENLSDKYSKIEKGKMIVGSIIISGDKPIIEPPTDKGLQGYRFTSKDKREVAQFRIDGFTFSRLSPYTNWEEVLNEAKRLWQLYYLKAKPQVVDKISVHYINRLNLPLLIEDFEEYLTASPTLPKTLPQLLSDFLIRLVVHENDLVARIIQTRIDSPKKDHMGVIMDIDTFKQNTGGIDDNDIWPTFDRLHELKNRIFFELITEKTVRLFE